VSDIPIFQREIADGVADLVRSTASVAYFTGATLVKPDSVEDSLVNRIKAENKDQIDLYYLEAILVSTNWNGNDDVFLPEQTWAARSTPEDKPFNYMHDENDIIGHITGSYVVDRDGNRIQADAKTHPGDFDIVTRIVLYTSWANEENRERMNQIIAEIEGDEEKWFVSMECLFSGFDYAVQAPDGSQYIVARNEETAFLTSKLRAYGGDGTHEGYKIGRAIRNISFSGEGLVDNPANKRSRITKPNASVAFQTPKNVTIGELNMSDVLKEQNDALKAELAEAKEALKTMQAENDAAKAKEIEAQVSSHEAEVAEKDASIAELTEKVSALETEVKDSKDAVKAAEDSLAKSEEEVDKMKKEKKDKERKCALLDAGVDADKADETLASLESLDDEAFATVISLYESKKAEASSSDDDEDGSAEADESDDDGASEADALEDTEASENLPKGDDSSDTSEAKTKVVAFLEGVIG